MELKVLVILVIRIFVIGRNRDRIFPTIVPVVQRFRVSFSMDCSGKISRIRSASGVNRAGNKKSPSGFRAYKSNSRN